MRPDQASVIEPVWWTARALPSVLILASADDSILDPRFRLAFPARGTVRLDDAPEAILRRGASAFRVHQHGTADPPAILLPLDKLFNVRTMAALRLWRTMAGRKPGPNPAALSPHQRKRLILALRALDGRFAGASYREIATVLLQVEDMPDAEWQTDERRGQVIRLVRMGTMLMTSGYRNLLLYPYRRRS